MKRDVLSQKTRSQLPVKTPERPFFEVYSVNLFCNVVNLFHNVVRLDQISNNILVNLLTPKVTHHCYHRFFHDCACCTTFFFFCNKARMLLTPWGRVSCISKTTCFSVNCTPFSLQFGWNEEPKGSNGSHPSECSNRTPPSKLDTAPFSRGKASANQRLSCH